MVRGTLASVVVGVLVAVTGCASGSGSAPRAVAFLADTPKGHLFTDPQGEYRLTIGDDWIPLTPEAGAPGVYAEDELWQVPAPGSGFPPDVSIISDDAGGQDLAEYLDYSRQIPYGNKILASTIVKSNDGRDLALFEFTGEPRGVGPAHYLAVADISGGRVVLATLSTVESDFATYGPKLKPFLLTLRATST